MWLGMTWGVLSLYIRLLVAVDEGCYSWYIKLEEYIVERLGPLQSNLETAP
jgi:hypothetical protein